MEGVKMENGQIVLDGYPEGTTFHGLTTPLAESLKRLSVFMGELQQVEHWLRLIPEGDPTTGDPAAISAGLADAALIGFCRCFDLNHPLKPLKPKRVFSPEQRDQLDRLKNVRNKLVAHDEQLTHGVFTLIARSRDLTAVEAVSLSLQAPFSVLPDLARLRVLQQIALEWVRQEHWRVATEIVQAFDALPMIDRALAPHFSINVNEKDVYAPKVKRTKQK